MKSTARARLGASIGAARRARSWTQQQLAGVAGVSQSLVSLAERGGRVELDNLERVCSSLGGTLTVEARFPELAVPRRQLDVAHARCVASMRRLLERQGHACLTEQEVRDGAHGGWIDLLAFDAARHRLIVVEVKTELFDAGGLERQVGRYARLCLDPARRAGWRVAEVVVAIVVLVTAANDAFLDANRESLRRSFPIRGGEAVACLLEGGPVRGRLLVMIDPRRRGRRALGRARVDGRRTAAPYRDYRDFVVTLGKTPASRRGGGRGGQ